MIISSVRVQNFRSIYDETLHCQNLTVLVGPNGTGKSSFLQALDMFYTSNARFSDEDYYNKDTSNDIIITITFDDLLDDEIKLFQKYVESGTLKVEKRIRWDSGRVVQKYHGSSLTNPEFDSVRKATGVDIRKKYNELKDIKYSDLPDYTNKEEAEKVLQEWEETHPYSCTRQRDSGQFFGFKEVGKANLERFTRFILVPAVRDASEDVTEKKGTPLKEIMDFVVRSILIQRKEIIELQEEIKEQYDQIMDPTKIIELQNLEKALSETLTSYVPDTEVKLTWLTKDIFEIPMPKADVKLIEDEYLSSVERTGHGLQRAFILTMLQYLTLIQMSDKREIEELEDDKNEIQKVQAALKLPQLILAVEEPELYQHPNRQRHLAKIFLKLASGDVSGGENSMQIIYCSHSPLFVDIKRFDKIRVFRKIKEEDDKPKQTKVIQTNLDEVAKILEKVDEKPEGTFTGKSLEPRLQTLMTPWMNEGFFADVVVLVEGEEDRAAILGIATVLGHDFESIGVSVIPCMGKNNIDRPTIIFRKLQIPVYAIWDGDSGNKKAKPESNRRLLRLFNHSSEDWPEKVTEQFACFKNTLKDTMRTEIGDQLYDDLLEESCNRLCLTEKKHVYKNPQVVQEIISEARKKGKTSDTLEKIIHLIVSLKD